MNGDFGAFLGSAGFGMDASWKLQCVYTDFLIVGGHPSTWHCTFSKTVTKSVLIDQPNTTTLTQTIYKLTGSKMFQIQNWKITVLNGAKALR